MRRAARWSLVWLVVFGIAYLLCCVLLGQPVSAAVRVTVMAAAVGPGAAIIAERLPSTRRVGAEAEARAWFRTHRPGKRLALWDSGWLRESRGTVAFIPRVGSGERRFAAGDVREVSERAPYPRETWWVPASARVLEVTLADRRYDLAVRPGDVGTVRGWLAPAVEAS